MSKSRIQSWIWTAFHATIDLHNTAYL